MIKTKNQKTHHTFAMSLYDIHHALQDSESDNRAMADMVTPEYHEYLPLFRKVNAEQLLLHCPYDHQIELQERFTPGVLAGSLVGGT